MTVGYDAVGNIISINDTIDPSYNRFLGYDALDRITTINGPWGTGQIGYDLRGNITGQRLGSFNLNYAYEPAAQRLKTVSGSKAYAMTYDLYGNVTSNGVTTFAYNDASTMQCANCGLAGETLYDYDGKNQRVKILKNGVETFFVYGIGGQLLWEETPDTQIKEYVYLNGKQVAVRELFFP